MTKDLPHHMQKLNKKVLHTEISEEIASPRKQTPAQIKKQAKAKLSKTRHARTPTPLTEAERNEKMTQRVPVFERLSRPKTTKQTRKKTPRL